MKTYQMIIAMLALLSAVATGCTETKIPAYDNEIGYVMDVTDMMPYPSADDLLSPLGLKDDPFQSLRVVLACASDREISDETEFVLPNENRWLGNRSQRKDEITFFKRRLQGFLDSLQHAGSRQHSIIYPTFVREANRLARSTAKRRIMVVCSDLLEHGAKFNFYRPGTMSRIQQDPESVEQELDQTAPLTPLKGLQVYLIYNPGSYDQSNKYMAIAGLYRGLITSHGGSIHIATKFQPL